MQTDQLLAEESGSAQPLPTRRRPLAPARVAAVGSGSQALVFHLVQSRIPGNLSHCATPCASRRSVSFSACWHRVTVSYSSCDGASGPVTARDPAQTLASFQVASQLTMLGAGQPRITVPCLDGEILALDDPVAAARKKPRLIATLARGHDGGGGTAPICRSRPRVSQWTHSSTNLPSTIWLSSCPST